MSDLLFASVVLLIFVLGIWAAVWILRGGMRRAGPRFHFGCVAVAMLFMAFEAVCAFLAGRDRPSSSPGRHLLFALSEQFAFIAVLYVLLMFAALTIRARTNRWPAWLKLPGSKLAGQRTGLDRFEAGVVAARHNSRETSPMGCFSLVHTLLWAAAVAAVASFALNGLRTAGDTEQAAWCILLVLVLVDAKFACRGLVRR